jgi:hypothetical protein
LRLEFDKGSFSYEQFLSLMEDADDAFDTATGGTTAMIFKLSDELRILKGEATEATIALEKLSMIGADPRNIAIIREQLAEKAAEKDRQKIEDAATSLLQSIRTPMEVLEDSIAEINRLTSAGGLTDEQRLKALDALSEDIDKETPGGGPRFGAALQAGSVEAFSAILAATQPGQDSERETAANTKKMADQLAANARIEEAKENPVPVNIPGLGGA